MGLLQALALEALSGYFPGLDLDSLRVNLLKGRVDLRDVDLTPGQVFSFAGFPFRLSSGQIGTLGLHLPWASIYSAPIEIDARNVQMHFEEVRFPNSQREVFEALRDANRRQKNRTLAEGERTDPAITRALQKFLPMLLDRVHADIANIKLVLHFATGESAIFYLEGFETTSVETASMRKMSNKLADLAKTITARGITFAMESSGDTLLKLEQNMMRLYLGLGSGACNADLMLSEPLIVGLKLSLGNFLITLKNRVAIWARAMKHQRPNHSVLENARSWFHYAVRVVRDMNGLADSNVSMGRVHKIIPMLSEYKRLHVRRLRKHETLQDVEEERIAEIEDSLDSDMILFLRRHARADVMAEEVSAFATKDWLSWALFDYRMSAERERLAAEIRKSLSVADQAERGGPESSSPLSAHDTKGAISRGWSKANVSLTLKAIHFDVGDDSDIISISVKNTVFCAQLDSSLQAYGMSLSMSEFLVQDGDIPILSHKSILDGAEQDRNPPSGQDFLEAKLQKTAFEKVTTLSICIAPLSALLVLNHPSIWPILNALRIQLSEQNWSSGVLPESKRLLLRSSLPSPSQEQDFAISIHVPRIEIILCAEPPFTETAVSYRGLVLSLNAVDVNAKTEMSELNMDGSCQLMIRSCTTAPHIQDSLNVRPEKMKHIVQISHDSALHIETSLTFEQCDKKFVANVGHIHATLDVSRIRDLLVLLSPIAVLRSTGRSYSALGKSAKEGLEMGKVVLPSIQEHEIKVSLLRLKLSGSEGIADSGTLLFTASEILSRVKPDNTISFSAQDIALEESVHGGLAKAYSTSQRSKGCLIDFCTRREETPTIEVKCNNLVLRLNPPAACSSLSLAMQLRTTVTDWFAHFQKSCLREANLLSGVPDAEHSAIDTRISLLIREASVNVFSDGNNMLLSCQNVFVVSHRTVLSGSLDALHVKDLSGNSGRHDEPIKFVPATSAANIDRRALSFNHAPNITNVHLYSLRFTVLRSFIEHFVSVWRDFSMAIRAISFRHWNDSRELRDNITHSESNASTSSRTFTLQGSALSFYLPLSMHGFNGVSFETSHFTVSHARDALAFSVRRLSILTRGGIRSPNSDCQDSSPKVADPAEWAVLVRALDLDFSRNARCTIAQSSEMNRSEWNLQILSKATLFATPSQIRMLQILPRVSEGTSNERAPSDAALNKGVHGGDGEHAYNPKKPMYEHWSLKVETQAISVELFNEDDMGCVVSTIASLEVGPVDFSLRRACEGAELEQGPKITRWTATSSSLRLEDSCPDTVVHLREVIRNNSISGPSAEDVPLSSGEIKSPIYIEGISRTDLGEDSRCSVNIELRNLRLILATTLTSKLFSFVAQCSMDDREDCVSPAIEADYVPNAKTRRDEMEEKIRCPQPKRISKQGLPLPNSRYDEEAFTKISICLSDSAIQIFGTGPARESSILVEMDLLNIILMQSEAGYLLPGSQMRLKEAATSIIWLPLAVLQAEGTPSRTTQSKEFGRNTQAEKKENVTKQELSLQHLVRSSKQYSRSSPVEGKRLLWNVFRQGQGTLSSISIGVLRGGLLKFPVLDSNRFVCVISTVTLDCSIQWLQKFAYLLSVLDVIPDLDGESLFSTSPIQFSVNSFLTRLQVPTPILQHSTGFMHRSQATIRIRSTIKLVLGKDLSGFKGSIKVSVDAIDEGSGVRDQILSPSSVDFEAVFAEDVSLSLSSERLLRIAVSPLMTRVLTSVAFVLANHAKCSSPSPCSKIAVSSYNAGPGTSAAKARGILLSISIRGISVCFVAESPRVQLLRLSLRKILICALLPAASNTVGSLDISLQDLTLEDTISWRFRNEEDTNDDSILWKNVFAGTHRNANLSTPLVTFKTPRIAMKSEGGSPASGLNLQSCILDASSQDRKTKVNEGAIPMWTCSITWSHPRDHVTGYMQMRPFDLNVDMNLLPHLKEWYGTVRDSAIGVQDALQQDVSFSPSRCSQHHECVNGGTRIGVDHIVIEPITMKVSAKALSRRISETIYRRFLMWLLGSESSVGTTIQLPRIIFNGDFDTMSEVGDRIRTTYRSALASRHIGRQLFWQASRLSRLARVLAMTMLRNRQVFESELGPRFTSPGRTPLFSGRQSLGLQELMRPRFRVSTGGNVMSVVQRCDPSAYRIENESWRQVNALEGDHNIETLDLTSSSKRYREESHELDGKSLFRWLRRNDTRVPNNDKFELFAPYSMRQSILLTSNYLFFISRTTRRIQDPVIPRAHIVEYHVTGQRITIVSARPVATSTARSAARQQFRDTFSLAEKVSENIRISEISMHEIECNSPQYANWLRSRLPSPNVILSEFLS